MIESIRQSFLEINTGSNRHAWAQRIIDQKVSLLELMPLLDAERPVAQQFTCLFGDVAAIDPTPLFEIVLPIFHRRNDKPVPNFDRTVAALLARCGIPPEIEGEAVDQLFQWLADPKITVMTKTYALDALVQATKPYPELRDELKLVMQSQQGHVSGAFDRRMQKVMATL